MIKVEDGTVTMKGPGGLLMGELAGIIASFREHFPKEMIMSAVEYGLEAEKEKIAHDALREMVLEMIKEMSRQEEERHGREKQE